MGKKHLFLCIITILAMIFLISLPEIRAESQSELKASSYNTEFYTVENKIFAIYLINFNESVNVSFSIELPKDAQNIEAYADLKKISFISEDSLEESKKIKLEENNTKEIKISFITSKPLEKSAKSYFLYDLKVPIASEKLNVKLILPEYAILDKPGSSSVFPEPLAVLTDGQKITLEWQKENIEKNKGISIFVIFREKTETDIFLIISVIVAIFLLLTFLILTKKRQKKAKTTKTKKRKIKKTAEIEDHLLESEKAVINALKEANKELWQKQIQLKTGFSKAKLSRVIRDLESRDLVKKIPLGNTNKIRLK